LLPVFVLALGYGADRRKFTDSRNVAIVIAILLVYAAILWLQLKVFRLDKGSPPYRPHGQLPRPRFDRAAAVLRRRR
jgi:hypothetical protein